MASLINKILQDDVKDKRIVAGNITDPDKKGTCWLLIIYKSSVPARDLVNFNIDYYIKVLCTIEWVMSIVGQHEIGEFSKEEHISISVTLDKSQRKPIPQFREKISYAHINSERGVNYDSYCRMDCTRKIGTEAKCWYRNKTDQLFLFPSKKRIIYAKVVGEEDKYSEMKATIDSQTRAIQKLIEKVHDLEENMEQFSLATNIKLIDNESEESD